MGITLLVVLTIAPLAWVIQIVSAVLYENGTCANDNFTKEYNRTINTNGTVDDFLKSLPSDNIILAEIICQDNSNETITKQTP
jgi:hypothetical protein